MGRAAAGTTVCRPVVYGSIAFFLGKKATEGNSHKWSIYLRGLDDEDLSYFVKRVVFTLHPSCQIPVVTCDEPPFVVTQTGWGEFDVKLTIDFVDPNVPSVDIIHSLRLYPPGVSAGNTSSLMRKPVVNENYEELLFHDPPQAFFDLLCSHQSARPEAANPPADGSAGEAPPKSSGAAGDASGEGSPAQEGSEAAAENPSNGLRRESGGKFAPELCELFAKVSEVKAMQDIVAAQTFVRTEIDRTCRELAEVEDLSKALRRKKAEEAASQVAGAPQPAAGAPPAAKRARMASGP